MADYAIHDTTLEAIADTIRKKDGTQALIDPADYADRINLMGMLEEKTVSGSVASCSDGADAVPVKSWEIEIEPNLNGKSQIIATQAKKNFIDDNISNLEQGSISGTSGKNSATVATNRVRNITMYKFPYDKIYRSYTLTRPTDFKIAMRFYDSNGNYVYLGSNYSGFIGSLPASGVGEDIQFVRFVFAKSDDSDITPTDIKNLGYQLEIGSSATSFEPYVAPVDKTVNLGQTIYGGQADVVNGTGTETHNKITLSSLLTDLNVAQIGTTGVYRIRFSLADAKGAVNSAVFDGLCDYYTPLSANQTYNKNEGISINTSGQCYIYDSRFNTSTSLNDFKTWIDANPVNLCYELATSIDFTFTPITPTPETALGVNNFWADTGDSEVTYRSSGTVTPVVPTLISKSITENDTYNASDDNADGYSQVTVNVPTAPIGMLVMDFTSISSPFTLNGVYYGSTGAVFDNTSDYIDLPFFHAGMEIEIDVASISLGQNANRRFFSSYRNQGFLYRNSNVWSFYNGSWYDTDISDSAYFDNSTVKIVVDSNNYWHIYKDDVLIFEPAGSCAISEPAIGSKDGSCINNATITGIRMKEVSP